VSLAIFGSVARRIPNPESDLDILVLADRLPDGRMARVKEFEPVEQALAALLMEAERMAPGRRAARGRRPSLMVEELPAVTVPPGLKAGLRAASSSRVVSRRGPSSDSTMVSSALRP